MENFSSLPSSTISTKKTTLHGSVRQPVSCEPCRRRKIKCSRSKPPCDTCRRRNCAENCVYKGARNDPILVDGSNAGNNRELLLRISNLESMLQQHTGLPVPSPLDQTSNRLLSPPVELTQPQQSQDSPETISFLSTTDSPSQYTSSSASSSSRGIGALRTSSNANVRYESPATQWNSVLANTSLSLSATLLDNEDEGPNESSFPFSSSKNASLDELLALLPPMQQCDYLKNTYFAVFSPLFHILHDPSFHAQYACFLEDPSSVQVSWLAILFVLISLAVTALEETDPILRDLARGPEACTNIRLLSKRYREAAMQCLAKQGVLWGRHNVQSLQALVLLLYAMGHSQDHTWVLLGMTYNIAVALGCHIDPEHFDLTPIQCEERRRCWAGLMMQYTIHNMCLGNLDPSWRTTSQVNLPADVNDSDITSTGLGKIAAGPTQMSYLLFKFRLYDVSARICRDALVSEPKLSTIQELDREISLIQESWESRYLTDSTFDALPTHHAVHLHILYAYSHQLSLLLHRPFFAKSILGLDVPNDSQVRCIASAEALLDIHGTLSETPEFRPFIWYTNGLGSFHAFHAAAVLAVTLLMPIYKPQYGKLRQILNQTLARFEDAARRSRICEKSARILRFLLATPSPNHISNIENISHNPVEPDSIDDVWLGGDRIKLLTDRLEPQQWLAPGSMDWTEWENLMASGNEVRD